MTQYIDKDVLVKKIKDLKLNINWISEEFSGAKEIAYDNVLDAIYGLEVKEVDLDREIDRVWNENSDVIPYESRELFEYIAEHFFELGLKTRKGE